jgi:hypothetical protein
MRRPLLLALFLILLLAAGPATAGPRAASSPPPSFLAQLWEQVKLVLPLLAPLPPAPADQSPGATDSGASELGLGLDPNG